MIEQSYRDFIDYEIEGYYDCENHGCDDEGICRCFKITDVNINSINILSISNSIFSELFDIKSKQYKRDNKISQILYGFNQEVDLYCIDRILRINNLWDKDNWISHWSSGYYGDELDNINIEDSLYKKIDSDISYVISLPNLKEKIEFLLIKEYGYLLDKIKDKSYEVIEVNKTDIVFGQDLYHKEVIEKCNEMEYYKDNKFDLIRGICLLKKDKWWVIDGYHRLLTSKKDKIKIIGIYENE